MKATITSADILSEIEIELLQGSIVRDQLGTGVRDVRLHNNQVRSEILAAPTLDLRDVASRQFQINDMLLTLFHETTAKLQELQLELRKSVQLIESGSLADSPAESTERRLQSVAQSIHQLAAETVRQREAIETAMRRDALTLELDARPISIPLIGGLLTRLRTAIHSLTLFYATRLANRQTDVNRLYGDYLLDLLQSQQSQTEELQSLRQQMALLEEQLRTLQNNPKL